MLSNHPYPSPRLLALGALTLPLILSGGALAAEPAATQTTATPDTTADVVALPETVVTATRFPVPIETVGGAITVINAQQIAEKQKRFVSDLLRDVPGVAVNRSGSFGGLTEVRIRGAESNQTLVIIDGVKMNDPAGGGVFDFANLLSSDIERIEVLRGPQATLYGSNSIGGVVNIITRGGKGPARIAGHIEGGSFKTLNGGVSASGGSEQVYGAFGLSGLRSDGINISRDGNEKDDFRNWTMNGRLTIKPTDQLEFQGSLRYIDSKLQFDDFGAVSDPDTGFIIPNDADLENKTQQWSGRVQGKLSLFDDRWVNTLGYSGLRSDNDSLRDGSKTFKFNADKDIFDFQSNAFLETPEFANATHDLTLLVEHQRETGENSLANLPTIRNTGYALDYRGGFWDSLYLTIGGRYDDNSRFENEFSPKLTAAYLIHDVGTRLHGSWGKGVQNPTLTELFGFDGNFIGNPNLNPETSTGWDIGVEQKFLDGRVTADATWFNNRIEDFISSSFDPVAGASQPVNLDGRSKVHGLELSLSAKLMEQLDFNASYTYTNSEDPTGAELVRRPKHIAAASINYRFLADRANLNLEVQYNGSQEDLVFIAPFFEQARANLDAYTLVNVAASYRLMKGVELTGRVENLLDKDYEELFGYRSPGIAGYIGIKGEFGL